MRGIKSMLLWFMDVMVGVFIGEIDHGERAGKVRRIVAHRGWYTIGFGIIIVLIITLYTLLTHF